jgi:hypothetical protein
MFAKGRIRPLLPTLRTSLITTRIPANRATWNFDYSVNTLLGGGHGKIDQFDFKMTLSENNSAPGGAHHTETFDLHPTLVLGTTTLHNVWVSESNSAHMFGGGDDNVPAPLTSSQAQNSMSHSLHSMILGR